MSTSEATLGSTFTSILNLIQTTVDKSVGTVSNTLGAIETSSRIVNRTVEVADNSNETWAATTIATNADNHQKALKALADASKKSK